MAVNYIAAAVAGNIFFSANQNYESEISNSWTYFYITFLYFSDKNDVRTSQ
jgi:hypothetical protein